MSEKTVVFEPRELGFPESALEHELIVKYLDTKGYKMSDLKGLPEQKARELMIEACQYAALKLAEIHARSEFRRKIEGPD
jgi:hypothetical protein